MRKMEKKKKVVQDYFSLFIFSVGLNLAHITKKAQEKAIMLDTCPTFYVN